MRRSDTSRACVFSSAVTVLAPRPRPGLGFWVFCGFWVFVSGDAKCLLFSAGEGPVPGRPWIKFVVRFPIAEVTSI
jgi:hypothetical protein